jgi:hypothetical protein
MASNPMRDVIAESVLAGSGHPADTLFEVQNVRWLDAAPCEMARVMMDGAVIVCWDEVERVAASAASGAGDLTGVAIARLLLAVRDGSYTSV